jgi:hypothetical protein
MLYRTFKFIVMLLGALLAGITVAAIVIALMSAIGWAQAVQQCTTHTYMLNGKTSVCTTCCWNGNCNTTCI